MVAVNDSEMLWHNDGHAIYLRLNKTEVEIFGIDCPNSPAGPCHNDRYGCIVKHFIGIYGLECNVGVCPAREKLQICWSLVGDKYDTDSSQLWFVPLEDEAFHSWLATRPI